LSFRETLAGNQNTIGKDICCRAGINPAIYSSVGKPGPAVGVDIGESIIARYDETHKEVVGIL
jgi:hypothetical protein